MMEWHSIINWSCVAVNILVTLSIIRQARKSKKKSGKINDAMQQAIMRYEKLARK